MEKLSWQKSSYSSEGNNCVELARQHGHASVLLRESDAPSLQLATTPDRLSTLLKAARSGKFSDLS